MIIKKRDIDKSQRNKVDNTISKQATNVTPVLKHKVRLTHHMIMISTILKI